MFRISGSEFRIYPRLFPMQRPSCHVSPGEARDESLWSSVLGFGNFPPFWICFEFRVSNFEFIPVCFPCNALLPCGPGRGLRRIAMVFGFRIWNFPLYWICFEFRVSNFEFIPVCFPCNALLPCGPGTGLQRIAISGFRIWNFPPFWICFEFRVSNFGFIPWPLCLQC